MPIAPSSLPKQTTFLEDALAERVILIGEVFVELAIDAAGEYRLRHRDDTDRASGDLRVFSQPQDADEIARYDDAGAFRPLKTAPNLAHGWLLEVRSVDELKLALDAFYPGRVGALLRWQGGCLPITPFRDTLGRQTGMYRVTQKITDDQAIELIGRFCRSQGGCARTILWGLHATGTNTLKDCLPPEKFDPGCDQVQAGRGPDVRAIGARNIPLFCQEACNLLVAEARTVVKAARPPG